MANFFKYALFGVSVVMIFSPSIKSMENEIITIEKDKIVRQDCYAFNDRLMSFVNRLNQQEAPTIVKHTYIIQEMRTSEANQHLLKMFSLVTKGQAAPFDCFMHVLKSAYADHEEFYYKEALWYLFMQKACMRLKNIEAIALGYDTLNKIGIFYFRDTDEQWQSYLINLYSEQFGKHINSIKKMMHHDDLFDVINPQKIAEIFPPDITVRVIDAKIIHQYNQEIQNWYNQREDQNALFCDHSEEGYDFIVGDENIN